MENIANYQITQTLYSTEKTTIFLALNEKNEKFVLKTTAATYPTPQELKRLETEYAISQNVQGEGIPKTYALLPQGSTVVIVEEYIDSPNLGKLLKDKKLSVEEALKIAISIAKTIAHIHQKNVIHKDINSNNILVNPETLQTTIIDFDIATQLSVENKEITNINHLEGSLLYISPEQTGRMNRNIDYRTDLYSLGVVMYEALTGELPFKFQEQMELIHAHIALMPKAPHLVNQDVPTIVSEIVLKLLAKNAEDRYQSAKGLISDLENCLAYINKTIENFAIGKADYSDKFHIPQKLYGREDDRAKLLQVFEEVCQKGEARLMLVKGLSGIGKSALIQEVQKPITQQKGYYIKGKFEQFQRDIPYSAIIDAFNILIDNILTEPKQKLNKWRQNILKGLAGNGQVIIEVLPRLELIIGKQPAIEKLPPMETQNRFNYTFEQFIKLFTQKENPIVLVVDDLQWADNASLQLIELFLKNDQNQYLFVIASYRDNEVDETHPLTLMLKDLSQHTTIESLYLQNLSLQHVQAIVTDTLKTDENSSASLAQLIFDKTQGNPFFVNQFLVSLYEEKLLTFDYNTYQWTWDSEKIKTQNITANVVELLINKIEKLPKETINLLQLAAAYNHQFDINTLQILSDTESAAEIEKYLVYAQQEQLILSTENAYRFQHDRIQQAAYSLIAPENIAAIHLKIGLTLLNNTPNEKLEQAVFDIINHLNKAKDLITEVSLLKKLRDMNFYATIKAKNANAYASALAYANTTLGLVSENIWQEDYTFALKLFKELIEIEYLNGNFEKTEKYVEIILENAKENTEKADIYNTLIIQATLQSKYAEAIRLGKIALSLLDFTIPDDANLEAGIGAGIGAVMQNLAGRDILSLVDAPDAQEARDILVARILVNLAAPAFLSNPNLWTFIIVNATALGLEKGNVPELCTAYSSFGILAGIIFNDYVSAYQYGEFAYKLSEKYNNLKQKSTTCFVLGTFLLYPTQPTRKLVPTLKEGVQVGMQSGEFQYASNNAMNIPAIIFLQGGSADMITRQNEESLKIALKYQNLLAITNTISISPLIDELTHINLENTHNLPYKFDEIITYFHQNQSFTGLFTIYFLKSITDFVMNRSEDAHANSIEAQKYLPFMMGTAHFFLYYFYYTLIQLQGVKENLDEVLEQTKDSLAKIKHLSEINPDTFQSKYILLQAEIARLKGDYLEAMDLYETAVNESRRQEFIFENAITAELTALFYEKLNKPKIAQIYWQESHQSYNIWGATKKVEQLQKKYTYLLKSKSIFANDGTIKATITQTSISTGKTTNIGADLDFITLLKASQMLSQEVVLESLLEKMMKILIENSGAQRGFLFLNRNDKPYLEAEIDTNSEKVKTLQAIALEEIKEDEIFISTEVVNFVLHTQKVIVLNDATQSEQFKHTSYITNQKVKSLLCMPLLKTGKIVGVLYLENNLNIGAFTKQHLEVLNVLSSQMAISVENALLYENLEDKVKERTLQLNDAYDSIKQQNENITQSINYGQRIQEAILPNIQEIRQGIKDSFVLFKPRDIVSGDFYWFVEKDNKVVIAAVDCTGHGVPGAFMSMIGYALLTEIIDAKNIFSPSVILKTMDEEINNMLKQDITQNRDGMDLALCVWNKNEKNVLFAGAKNPLIYIQQNEVKVIKGNKFSIGGEMRKQAVVFEEHIISIDAPTYCYIYSDGYQDQFGGEENKKFMKGSLKSLLFQIHQEDMDTQKNILDKTLTDWRGKLHQTDDVLLIGFKVS